MSKAFDTSSPSSAMIGKPDLGARHRLDVADPARVLVHAVDGHADHLGVSLLPFVVQLRHGAELGRADWREVLRVREQDRPAVADPVVEPDLALVGLRREVRHRVVDAKSHGPSLESRPAYSGACV
jgi:hypothetical protein